MDLYMSNHQDQRNRKWQSSSQERPDDGRPSTSYKRPAKRSLRGQGGFRLVVQTQGKEREWYFSLAFNLWSKSHLLVVDRTNEDVVIPCDNTPPVRAFTTQKD